MREKFEYFLAVLVIKISKICPISFSYKFFKFIAVLLYYTLGSRRKLAIKNLRLAYTNLTQKEIENIAKNNFTSLSKTLCESLLLYNDKKTLDELIINGKEAIETVNRLCDNGNRPVLFTTAHFGNWEALAHYFGFNGYKLVVVGREGNNLLIEKNITTPSRTKFGNALATKDNAMIKMVKFLKKGYHAGILIDQKPGAINSIPSTFFGRECLTSKAIAQLKLKFNPVIIPIFAIRKDDGRYEIIVKNFDESGLNGDSEHDTKFITQQINDIFEEVVRLDPAQWFWMHNRWKM
ncbi:lysophospholipid acyltransferase family protein [Campylobacter sp. RM9344]|uniref:Lysophospholipid acyltransferase family protein n=1 Tax=Campylobacter californiensis TaxID=1032243 RepID=A0AAW3ZTW7_9BACT|nr:MULTISPECIES: lysophospholipid acyltransferase family protein [unclassified Campylobacter]MBE2984320.1 lysophospholipid acyltransferase family protein [Campylobacter sp. RM6883]MBE2994813.1 lysophospholipid acyltransferase family protein [Campylobacter sp. RM6913]MBE3021413.1 lysophospholipid acyltransferase family protein [Campylobacter sp. 7477a]MBE3029411.1 lysophospholipid acyltransferase family protein [Campylobacter sp. RM9344]MBE3605631.1 lysophospholipid acyltransferase family prote